MEAPIAVAMSGGVDSSVVAARLQEQGHRVFGVTMRLWDAPPETAAGKPPHEAARIMADQLGIPHHVVELQQQFRDQVVAPFAAAYYAGRTPNPCARCNPLIKFGLLLEAARQLGADHLATGHYVGLTRRDGFYQLRKGADPRKDQSYFLFALEQWQLARCLFPLADLSKQQVRRYAAELQLSVADKAESQDVCFIPDGDYCGFLERFYPAGELTGEIVHRNGQLLGHHQGCHRYTIGQRKGLGIGWSEPLYVIAIDAARQRVIVGEKEYLLRRSLEVDGCTWSIPEPRDTFRASCRIRYRHHEVPAQITPISPGRVEVQCDAAQTGVTPGQAAVFYEGDRVLGGGWIR